MSKDSYIRIRVSKEQKEKVKQISSELGVTMTDFIIGVLVYYGRQKAEEDK